MRTLSRKPLCFVTGEIGKILVANQAKQWTKPAREPGFLRRRSDLLGAEFGVRMPHPRNPMHDRWCAGPQDSAGRRIAREMSKKGTEKPQVCLTRLITE